MRFSSASFTVSSGSGPASSSSAGTLSASLIAAEVLSPWLECASSMTMAKVLPPSVAISSRMKGNFCTVETMIFFFDELAQVAGLFGMTYRRAYLHELLDGRLDLEVEEATISDH